MCWPRPVLLTPKGSRMRSEAKRVLGVDLGLKRTGLAVSDALGITTRALNTLAPKSRAEDIAVIAPVGKLLM